MVSLVQQGVFKCHVQCCLCLYCILLHGPIIFCCVAISHALNPVINRLTFWLLLLSGCYRLCYYFHYCSVALWIHGFHIYWYSKLQVNFFLIAQVLYMCRHFGPAIIFLFIIRDFNCCSAQDRPKLLDQKPSLGLSLLNNRDYRDALETAWFILTL